MRTLVDVLIALYIVAASLAIVAVSFSRAPKAIPIRVRTRRSVRVVRRD